MAPLCTPSRFTYQSKGLQKANYINQVERKEFRQLHLYFWALGPFDNAFSDLLVVLWGLISKEVGFVVHPFQGAVVDQAYYRHFFIAAQCDFSYRSPKESLSPLGLVLCGNVHITKCIDCLQFWTLYPFKSPISPSMRYMRTSDVYVLSFLLLMVTPQSAFQPDSMTLFVNLGA